MVEASDVENFLLEGGLQLIGMKALWEILWGCPSLHARGALHLRYLDPPLGTCSLGLLLRATLG